MDWVCYISSIAKIDSKKTWALKFVLCFFLLGPGVALYLYKFIIRSCMEYCYHCHIWAGAPSSYLELLGKQQKQIYRTVGYVGPLVHRRNGANLSLFYTYYFGNWLNCFHFFIVDGGLLVVLIDCMILMSPFLCYEDVYVNSFFLAELDSEMFCLWDAFLWPMT